MKKGAREEKKKEEEAMYYGKVGGCADLLVGRRFVGWGKFR
jgi:hypothetical protein